MLLRRARRTNEQLESSLAKYLTAFRASPDALVITSLVDGKILEINEGFSRLLGYELSEVVGRSSAELHMWADPEQRSRLIETARQGESVRDLEAGLRTHSGEPRTCLLSAEVIEVGGQPSLLTILRDVTESKRLEESQSRLIAILEATTDLVAMFDKEGRTLYLNRAGRRMLEFDEDEDLGATTLAEYHPRKQGQWVMDELIPFVSSEGYWTGETVFESRSGREISTLQLILSHRSADGEVEFYSTIARDITERKWVEDALEASEAKFAAAFHSSPDTIMITALDDGEILEVNEGFTRFTGYRREEALGRNSGELGLWIDPKNRDLVMAMMHEQGEVRDFEIDIRNKSGEARTGLMSGAIIELEGKKCVIGVVHDITDRKRTEEEREAFVRELEAKNAELERFTYTVSHDLKSPLVTIRGFLGLLEQDAVAGDVAGMKRDVDKIRAATETMRQLLDEILELSRIGRLVNPPESVAVDDLAREAVELVTGQAVERGVEIEIAPELGTVVGDRPRLLEVMQNLIDNAIKFMGDQPAPRIEVGKREGDGEIVFFVRDNGIGIKARYQEKVFGLFDRLDLQIDGTGIGLALVKRIVEVHGGRVWIESEGLGHGSTFCFTLPLRAAAELAESEPP